MIRTVTLIALSLMVTSSAFAEEIVLSPGSKITVKPQIQTEITCSGVSSNRCLIKIISIGSAGERYVIVNQDDSILMSFDINKKTIDDVSYSLDMLKQKGICSDI